MQITVAICTWNRAMLLDRTLAEMRNLVIPAGIEWELLVVNNNCTDSTDEIISRHAPHLPLRRLLETKQGSSHARNCAIAAARGSLMIWTDDDVLVDPNWLSEYVAASEQYPDAVFFGGTINPWFEEEPPRNIRENLAYLPGPFGIRQLGPGIEPIDPNELPFGANMAFRTEILKRFPFNPSLGIFGQEQIRGSETDVMERLLRDGHKGVWVGSAQVRHYVPAARFSLDFLTIWYEGLGRGEARISPPVDKQLWGVPRWTLRRYWQYRLQELFCYCCNRTHWLRTYLRARRLYGFMQECRRLQSDAAITSA